MVVMRFVGTVIPRVLVIVVVMRFVRAVIPRVLVIVVVVIVLFQKARIKVKNPLNFKRSNVQKRQRVHLHTTQVETLSVHSELLAMLTQAHNEYDKLKETHGQSSAWRCALKK